MSTKRIQKLLAKVEKAGIKLLEAAEKGKPEKFDTAIDVFEASAAGVVEASDEVLDEISTPEDYTGEDD